MGRSRSPFYSVDLIRPVIHYKIPMYALLNWVGWREFALTVLYFIGNLQTFQCTHVMSKMNALHVKKTYLQNKCICHNYVCKIFSFIFWIQMWTSTWELDLFQTLMVLICFIYAVNVLILKKEQLCIHVTRRTELCLI